MRISDWSSDVCSSDLEMHDRGGDLYRWPFASSGETSCQRERTKADLAQGNSQRNQFVDTFPLFRQFCCSNHLRSEEHTSELQSLMRISYAVFCLKKKNPEHINH